MGTHFIVIVGFTIGVGGLFMEENLADRVLFLLHLLRVGEKDVIQEGIALSFDKEVEVFVQLSFNLLGHESVLL